MSPSARQKSERILVEGENVVPAVHAVLDKMAVFSEQVRSGAVAGIHRETHS